MRSKNHTHPCQHCGTPVECDGTYSENPDGWPVAVCDLFHRPAGVNPEFLCEACHEPPALTLDEDATLWAV